MKIKYLILFLGVCLHSIGLSQLDDVFTHTLGGTGNDGAQAICYDNLGNTYVTGYFSSTMDADPGAGVVTHTSAGLYDIYISKYSSTGVLTWSKRIGGTGNDASFGMDYDGSAGGGLYLTGYFSGTVDFDPNAGTTNLTASGSTETFILKIDANGNMLFAKQFNGSTQGYDIEADGYGQIYLTGTFGGTCDFNPGVGTNNLTTGSNKSAYIVRLDNSGSYQWARMIYGGMSASSTGFELSLFGGLNPEVYVTGSVAGAGDFDVGSGVLSLTANGGTDMFVLKLTFGGATVWAKTFGSPIANNEERAFGISTDASGNVYTTGQYTGLVDFDPGAGTFEIQSTSGSFDVFVQKMSSTGDFIDAISLGSSGLDIGYDLEVDSNDDLYVVGTYGASIDTDPGVGVNTLSNSGSDDVFVLKLTNDLEHVWALKIGGTGQETVSDVNVNSTNFYIAGYYHNTVDIDLSTGVNSVSSNGGSRDLYYGKYTYCVLPGEIASVSGAQTVCAGSSQSFVAASSFWATTYQWTLPASWTGNSTTSTVNAVVGSSGGTIGVSGVNNCGVGPQQTISITVNDVPVTPVVNGESTVCSGTGELYEVTADPSVSSYSWTLPGDWTGTTTSGSMSCTVGTSSGQIEVTASNSCGTSNPGSIMVTVNSTPDAPTFVNSPTQVCTGSENSFQVIALPNANSYNWTLPSGFSGSSNTEGILITTAGSDDFIEVFASNSCGNSLTTQFWVDVFEIPTINSNDLTICEGSIAEIEGSADQGTLYWYDMNTGGAILATGPILITAPLYSDTTFYLEAQNGPCVNDPRIVVNVTVNPMPNVGLNPGGGAITSLQDNATSYQWIDCNNSNQAVNNETAQMFVPTQNGTYAVVVNLNGCIDTSACEVVANVGLEEFVQSEIKVFPNPSMESFTIEIDKGITSVSIFRMSGELVQLNNYAGLSSVEMAPNVKPGVYFLKVSDSQGHLHITQWIKL